METIIVYPTWRETVRQKRRKNCRMALGSVLLLAASLFARRMLAGELLPDGALLEDLAQAVQGREVAVEEAVAAFCREIMMNGGA